MEIVQLTSDEAMHRSERKVVSALRTSPELEDVALHSIAWQGVRADRQGDGEADLVVLDSVHGVLVLEVKGGGIDVTQGKWHSTDVKGARHAIKNPFEQAKSSKHALIKYLKAVEPDLARRVDIVHGVVFPDVSCQFAFLGPDSPREIIIDSGDLRDLRGSLDRLFAHWGAKRGPNAADRRRLRSLLMPTLTVRPRLRDMVSEVETKLLRLTQEQVEAMQALRRNRRLVILGGAGTGKTLLAMAKARQLAETGSRTLLLCFNKPLADHVRMEMEGSGVTVETFHSLCTSIFDETKFKYPPPLSGWWESEAAATLVDLCERSGREYDAVLVDEAQDFQEDWLDALTCLLSSKEDSVFVLYGDHHQTLWQRGWEAWLKRHDWPHFELLVNCRNSLPIAAKVASIFGDPLRSNCAAGADPVFHQLDVRRENIAPVVSLVRRAIDEEGIKPEQIAVLTSSRDLAERFHATMVFDYQFAPIDRPGHITADTIHRFKGLEAAFVIVVLGPEIGDGESEQFRELKYTAYSRPTAVLHVFAPKGFRK